MNTITLTAPKSTTTFTLKAPYLRADLRHCNEEELLEVRRQEVLTLLAKCHLKARRAPIKRKFPVLTTGMTTAEYIDNYFFLNAHDFGNPKYNQVCSAQYDFIDRPVGFPQAEEETLVTVRFGSTILEEVTA